MKLISLLLLHTTLMTSSGCFYLVPEGEGGVAERFPIKSEVPTLQSRLNKCEAVISEHNLNGKQDQYPAIYQEIQLLVTRSRRLYEANYLMQAQLPLEQAEKLLHILENGAASLRVKSHCNQQLTQEACI
ncbi:hypothetical protein [Neptuniibacter sp. QD37_11]|uniref:hypothetical protein n=1 Tax=Neptuniibacter sp. QD37_11 TaxID=3398209 RepID=UPI0039F47E08